MNLRRDWLDGREDVPPHHVVDHYKHPALYGPWFQARQTAAPQVDRFLSVWKSVGTPVGPGADGPLCVVYEEVSEGLDGSEWSRYWLLTDEWHMGHAHCVENLAALVHVAQQAGVLVTIGKELRARDLMRLHRGHALVPELLQRTRRFARTLAQVAAQYQRRVDAWESADLRHVGGYALKLRGVTTTAGVEATPAVRR